MLFFALFIVLWINCHASSNHSSQTPTSFPTDAPTNVPTDVPTDFPTDHPTLSPTFVPSTFPTDAPSTGPSGAPTLPPTPLPLSTSSDSGIFAVIFWSSILVLAATYYGVRRLARNGWSWHDMEEVQTLEVAKKFYALNHRSIKKENYYLEQNFDDDEMHGSALERASKLNRCCQCWWYTTHFGGVRPHAQQKVRTFMAAILSLVDVYSDLFLFIQWYRIGLAQWATLGISFSIFSSIRGGLQLHGERAREVLRSSSTDQSINYVLCSIWFWIGVFDLSGFKYFYEAFKADRFSYNLAFRMYLWKSTELLETIPAAILGIYGIISRSVRGNNSQFRDVDLTDPLVWIQFASSSYVLSTSLRNTLIYKRNDRERYEGFQRIGFEFKLLIGVHIMCEYLHRTITMTMLWTMIGNNAGLAVATSIFSLIFASIVAFILSRYETESLFNIKSIKNPAQNNCSGDCDSCCSIALLYGFLVVDGFLELFVPKHSLFSLFSIGEKWNTSFSKWFRGIIVIRWCISGLIILISFVVTLQEKLLPWSIVSIVTLWLSFVITVFYYFFGYNLMKARFDAGNYIFHCHRCEGALEQDVVFDVKLLRRRVKAQALMCYNCKEYMPVFDRVYFCTQGLLNESHDSFICTRCLIDGQRILRDSDKQIKAFKLTCSCTKKLRRKLNNRNKYLLCTNCNRQIKDQARYYKCPNLESEAHGETKKDFVACLSCSRNKAHMMWYENPDTETDAGPETEQGEDKKVDEPKSTSVIDVGTWAPIGQMLPTNRRYRKNPGNAQPVFGYHILGETKPAPEVNLARVVNVPSNSIESVSRNQPSSMNVGQQYYPPQPVQQPTQRIQQPVAYRQPVAHHPGYSQQPYYLSGGQMGT